MKYSDDHVALLQAREQLDGEKRQREEEVSALRSVVQMKAPNTDEGECEIFGT